MIFYLIIFFIILINLLLIYNFVKTKNSRYQKKIKTKEHLSQFNRNVLNHKYLLKQTPKHIRDNMSITLKKNFKGVGIVATKDIKKGETIALYKIKVYQDELNKKYKSPTKCKYCFTLYSKKGHELNDLIGDLDHNDTPLPIKIKNKYIPYWAYFSNEPSKYQTANSKINVNTKENYKNRKKLKVNDYVVYKLVATKKIKKNSEITWCYGSSYTRDYDSSCSESN